jgi:hypothetical protein
MIDTFQHCKMLRQALLLCVAVLFLFSTTPASAQCANPSGVSGEFVYNTTHDLFQGCTPTGWVAFHQPPHAWAPPAGCPTIGNVCANGMIYAGDLNGNKLYIAANDAPTTLVWGPYPDAATGMALCADVPPHTGPGCDTGKENTQLLTAHPSVFPAADYCTALNAHGKSSGWYLPSRSELNVIYTNLKSGQPAGTFNLQNDYYWSSSESTNIWAWRQIMEFGWQNRPNKDNLHRVRCMWRE